MKFRFSNWKPSLVVLGTVTALAVTGCGDDGAGPGSTGGDGGIQEGPDGGGGGVNSEGEASDPTDGTAASPASSSPNGTNSDDDTEPGAITDGDGGTLIPDGDGGVIPVPVTGDVDDLIGAICAWEFRCCDDGERAFRFGPSIKDAETCRARFVRELRESNSTKNPFVAGSAASGLLASLAYSINLGRVEINEDAVAACTRQWNELGCNKPAPEKAEHCTASEPGATDPCSLNELFKPILEQDDTCTPGLGESATNDIECVVGTSCLAADDPANGNGVPSCIKRSLAGEFCQDDTDCDFGLYCDGDTCAEKGDEGDDCTYEDDQGSGIHPHTCKPGLSCDPQTDTCVAACTLGFECTSDYQCPDGSSCAPVYAANDELFHVCRELGSKSTDQCDDAQDCVESQYCKVGANDTIGNCAGDKDVGETCTGVKGECIEGTYCDPVEGTCEAYNTPDEECTRGDSVYSAPKDFPECSPATAGCFPRYDEDTATVKYLCRNAKNGNGADCWIPEDCQSGKCEAVSEAAREAEPNRTGFVCTSGADIGEKCDEGRSCKVGAVCDPENKCVAQRAPGADCENPDTEEGDAYVCANGVCSEQWDSLMCSDAPVPKAAGGTGVTCDGNK